MKVYDVYDSSFESIMATWRILRYKPYEPEGNKIQVEFEYRDTLRLNENVKFIRIFNLLTNESIAEKIIKNEPLDLSFGYIKNLNLKKIEKLCGNQLIFPSFKAEYACFDGSTSFDHAVIGDGEISFKNAVFGNGDTSFFQAKFGHSDISFYNVDFQRGSVSFAESVFGDGDLTFEYAIFGHGNAAFTGADFGKGDVFFGGAVFERGEVIFTDTKFGRGNVNFDYTLFGDGNASFDNAKFDYGTILFDHADFQKGEATFLNTDFGMGEVFFKETQFHEGTLDMSKAIGEKITFENCQFNNHDNLSFDNVKHLKLIGCINNKTLKISGANKISLKDTINLGYLYYDWDKNKVAAAIRENDDTVAEKVIQFSLLKQNYHKIGAYESEDSAFVEYMRCRRAVLGSKVLKGLDKLIDTIGVYGTKPGRVAATMMIVWFVFGIAFMILDAFGGAFTQGIGESWINGLYFSGVTFLTIGYGDIAPLLVATKILAPIEGVMGLFLMSYFTVSVVRKTLR